MKTVIILTGRFDTGKSSSLQKLIKQLAEKSQNTLLFPLQNHNEDLFWNKDRDGYAIIKCPKFTCGIITFGDPGFENAVAEALKACKNHNCDFIVAAARTRGGVYDLLQQFGIQNKYETIKISTLRLQSGDKLLAEKLNTICAQNIQNIFHNL